MEEQNDQLTEPTIQRPTLLKVLCILTFIWSGYQLISNLLIAWLYDSFMLAINSISETLKLPGVELIQSMPPIYFGVTGLICVGGIAGAYLMWNLKKIGFHIYTITQILLIIAPMYILKMSTPNMLDFLISLIFILLYARNLKWMK